MTTKMKIRVIGIVSILSVVTAGIAIGLSCSVLAVKLLLFKLTTMSHY